jgi:hypothetical protein
MLVAGILVTHACAAGFNLLSSLLLGEEVQSLHTLFDGAFLSDLVERLVLLFDIVLIFVVDMHIGALNVSKTYN